MLIQPQRILTMLLHSQLDWQSGHIPICLVFFYHAILKRKAPPRPLIVLLYSITSLRIGVSFRGFNNYSSPCSISPPTFHSSDWQPAYITDMHPHATPTLTMEAACSSRRLVFTYKTTLCHNPEQLSKN